MDVVDWSAAWPFVDVFKTARPWISNRAGAPFGGGGPLQLTPEGWVAALDPDQTADTVMFSHTSHYPAGRYVVLYDGDGTLQFDARSATTVSQSPGRIVLEVAPQPDGLWLHLTATTPGNPVRNIRFLMPGFESTYQSQPFHPTFLQRLARFKALRFKNWQRTDNSIVVTWSNRTTPSSAFQSSDYGVAPEYMIQLANTLHADAWLSMPHAATDDYVRQLATLARDQLDPGLKVYVEYSNETWNETFSQGRYVEERGLALGLAGDSRTAGLRYHAQRAVQVFALWEQVFGGRGRLVRVLASHGAVPATGVEVMDWQNAYQHADALAIAPYINPPGLGEPANLTTTLRMSVDQVLDAALSHVRDPTGGTGWEVSQNRANSRSRGLKLVAYEGGPSLVGEGSAQSDDRLTALFVAASRSARMRPIHMEYLNQWRAGDGDVFVYYNDVFVYSEYGSWGALEYQDQDPATAPKYQALMDFISSVVGTPTPPATATPAPSRCATPGGPAPARGQVRLYLPLMSRGGSCV